MKKKLLWCVAAVTAACTVLSACSAKNIGDSNSIGGVVTPPPASEPDWAGDGDPGYVYGDIIEQGFKNTKSEPSSYFSLDRNTATYSIVRSRIENGYNIDPLSVRVEEMINYFNYDFAAPEDKAVGVSAYLADCPWNSDNKLMMAGIKTSEISLSGLNSNYVFLIDVSGSMAGTDRIGLAKTGVYELLKNLGENDCVSLVTYASGVNTVLEGVECTEDGKSCIQSAVQQLKASGATNGGDGLERAYRIAGERFIEGGNNRVIIISDGDFNAGINNPEYLKIFIQDKAKSGVYLSVIGVGMGNMRDDMLETLATCGNGNYAYLDNETEAKKVFCEELGGTLKTVAKDAKAGVTFTENVEKYRLIGYDTKIISEDDFNDEDADTGEIGSNLSVVALYEIVLSDSADGKLADVEIKYKDVTGEGEISESVSAQVYTYTPASDDLTFAGCVAEFGLILRQSEYKDSASYGGVIQRLGQLQDYIADDVYKKEFINLVDKASENAARRR